MASGPRIVGLGCAAAMATVPATEECSTYWASWNRYMKSPSVRASYSASQSSPRKPLWTSRTFVVPPARPSMVYSMACITPSGPGVPAWRTDAAGPRS